LVARQRAVVFQGFLVAPQGDEDGHAVAFGLVVDFAVFFSFTQNLAQSVVNLFQPFAVAVGTGAA